MDPQEQAPTIEPESAEVHPSAPPDSEVPSPPPDVVAATEGMVSAEVDEPASSVDPPNTYSPDSVAGEADDATADANTSDTYRAVESNQAEHETQQQRHQTGSRIASESHISQSPATEESHVSAAPQSGGTVGYSQDDLGQMAESANGNMEDQRQEQQQEQVQQQEGQQEQQEQQQELQQSEEYKSPEPIMGSGSQGDGVPVEEHRPSETRSREESQTTKNVDGQAYSYDDEFESEVSIADKSQAYDAAMDGGQVQEPRTNVDSRDGELMTAYIPTQPSPEVAAEHLDEGATESAPGEAAVSTDDAIPAEQGDAPPPETEPGNEFVGTEAQAADAVDQETTQEIPQGTDTIEPALQPEQLERAADTAVAADLTTRDSQVLGAAAEIPLPASRGDSLNSLGGLINESASHDNEAPAGADMIGPGSSYLESTQTEQSAEHEPSSNVDDGEAQSAAPDAEPASETAAASRATQEDEVPQQDVAPPTDNDLGNNENYEGSQGNDQKPAEPEEALPVGQQPPPQQSQSHQEHRRAESSLTLEEARQQPLPESRASSFNQLEHSGSQPVISAGDAHGEGALVEAAPTEAYASYSADQIDDFESAGSDLPAKVEAEAEAAPETAGVEAEAARVSVSSVGLNHASEIPLPQSRGNSLNALDSSYEEGAGATDTRAPDEAMEVPAAEGVSPQAEIDAEGQNEETAIEPQLQQHQTDEATAEALELQADRESRVLDAADHAPQPTSQSISLRELNAETDTNVEPEPIDTDVTNAAAELEQSATDTTAQYEDEAKFEDASGGEDAAPKADGYENEAYEAAADAPAPEKEGTGSRGSLSLDRAAEVPLPYSTGASLMSMRPSRASLDQSTASDSKARELDTFPYAQPEESAAPVESTAEPPLELRESQVFERARSVPLPKSVGVSLAAIGPTEDQAQEPASESQAEPMQETKHESHHAHSSRPNEIIALNGPLNHPNVVFVLGGPGSGKGTQCTRLAQEFNLVHLSAGDLLRNEVNTGSEVGEMCSALMKEGKLVPMEITIGLLRKAMESHRDASGFLIDGFPRALDQAHEFERTIGPCRKALFYHCTLDILEQRLLERGKTSGRDDDNIDVIRKRFATFESQSMPVIDYYESQGKAVKISSIPPIEEVYAQSRSVFTDAPLSKEPELAVPTEKDTAASDARSVADYSELASEMAIQIIDSAQKELATEAIADQDREESAATDALYGQEEEFEAPPAEVAQLANASIESLPPSAQPDLVAQKGDESAAEEGKEDYATNFDDFDDYPVADRGAEPLTVPPMEEEAGVPEAANQYTDETTNVHPEATEKDESSYSAGFSDFDLPPDTSDHEPATAQVYATEEAAPTASHVPTAEPEASGQVGGYADEYALEPEQETSRAPAPEAEQVRPLEQKAPTPPKSKPSSVRSSRNRLSASASVAKVTHSSEHTESAATGAEDRPSEKGSYKGVPSQRESLSHGDAVTRSSQSIKQADPPMFSASNSYEAADSRNKKNKGDVDYVGLVSSLRREISVLKSEIGGRDVALDDSKEREHQLVEHIHETERTGKDILDKNMRILLDRQKKAYQILVAKLRREIRRLKFQRNSLADPLIEAKYFPYLPRTPYSTSARKPPIGIIGNLPPRSVDYFALNPPPPTGNHPDSGNRWWWGSGPDSSAHLPPARPKTAPSSSHPLPSGYVRKGRANKPMTSHAPLETYNRIPTPPSDQVPGSRESLQKQGPGGQPLPALPHKLAPIVRPTHADREEELEHSMIHAAQQKIDIKCGDRVCVMINDEKCLGMLKYLGIFDPAPEAGLWCGIKLDRPLGKHDGIVRGKRYFTCEENHGLFVKLDKVIPVRNSTTMRSHRNSKRAENSDMLPAQSKAVAV